MHIPFSAPVCTLWKLSISFFLKNTLFFQQLIIFVISTTIYLYTCKAPLIQLNKYQQCTETVLRETVSNSVDNKGLTNIDICIFFQLTPSVVYKLVLPSLLYMWTSQHVWMDVCMCVPTRPVYPYWWERVKWQVRKSQTPLKRVKHFHDQKCIATNEATSLFTNAITDTNHVESFR